MKLIYWSTAIKYWFPDFNREPKDLDIITDEKQEHYLRWIEYHRCNAFEYLVPKHTPQFYPEYVSPDELYTIKLSHLSWDINWDKHMHDVIFLKSKWCKIDKIFYNELIKRWEIIHWKKKVKMWVDNKDFFKWNIERRYNHDWLHEQYAFYDRPLNEKIREDLNSPLCSKQLWDKLSYEDKLRCALEELYVLSSERYIFVSKPRSIRFAKSKTLKQMIVSTTSWWFNLFLKENFEELLDYQPKHIIDKINLLTK